MENNLSKAISQIKFPVRYDEGSNRIVSSDGAGIAELINLRLFAERDIEGLRAIGHALAEMINGLDGRGKDLPMNLTVYKKANSLDYGNFCAWFNEKFRKEDPGRQVKSAEGDPEILIKALEHIGNWGDEEEERWDDPGDCAMDALSQYRYSMKNNSK